MKVKKLLEEEGVRVTATFDDGDAYQLESFGTDIKAKLAEYLCRFIDEPDVEYDFRRGMRKTKRVVIEFHTGEDFLKSLIDTSD